MAFPVGWRSHKITIPSSKINAALTGFVVTITLDNLLNEVANGSSHSALNGGGDIRFSSDDLGATRLACHVRRFVTNPIEALRDCEIKVYLPTLSDVSDNEFYIWYNMAGETQPAPGAAFGYNEVYQDWEFVLPLTEASGNGTAGEFEDVTGNGYNASLTTGTSISGTTAGHPYGASWLEFSSLLHALTISGSISALDLADVTMSCLQNADVVSSNTALFGNWDSGTSQNYVQFQSNGRFKVLETVTADELAGSGVTAGETTLMHAVWDRAAPYVRSYVHGVVEVSDVTLNNTTGIVGDAAFRIGAYYNNDSYRRYEGRMGEVRGGKFVLPQEYIEAEQANLVDPAAFAIPITDTSSIIPGTIMSGSLTPRTIR